MVSASGAISPLASMSIFCDRSPRATAVVDQSVGRGDGGRPGSGRAVDLDALVHPAVTTDNARDPCQFTRQLHLALDERVDPTGQLAVHAAAARRDLGLVVARFGLGQR